MVAGGGGKTTETAQGRGRNYRGSKGGVIQKTARMAARCSSPHGSSCLRALLRLHSRDDQRATSVVLRRSSSCLFDGRKCRRKGMPSTSGRWTRSTKDGQAETGRCGRGRCERLGQQRRPLQAAIRRGRKIGYGCRSQRARVQGDWHRVQATAWRAESSGRLASARILRGMPRQFSPHPPLPVHEPHARTGHRGEECAQGRHGEAGQSLARASIRS